MSLRRIGQFAIITFGVSICVVPFIVVGLLIGIPLVKDWQTQRSIIVVNRATYIFENTIQYTGSYKQKNLYYWSPKQISDIEQYYRDFVEEPFIAVNSDDEKWLISVLKGSNTIKNPTRKVSLHTDLCDYHEVFDCISIALFDATQLSLPNILQGMYSTPIDEIQSLNKSGTLIIFSYDLPDPA